MKAHSNDFKSNLVALGREFDDKIIYGSTTLGQDDISNVRMYYDSDLLKSTMKTLTFTSFTLIEKDTLLNYQIGLKVGNSYEYMNYGNFIVDKIEEQKDSKTYLYTCYDKMLYTMKDYESLGLTYPVTIRNYIITLCNKLGIAFKNASDTFVNYDKEITSELYLDSEGNSLGYTYRDVLDDIAEATASNIIINQDDELEIKYIDNTAPLGTIYGNTTQEGTPTPSNPQPINVVTGGNTISVVGKNLFSGFIKGYGLNATNGLIASSQTSAISEAIPVDFDTYSSYYIKGLTNTISSLIAGYNDKFEFIGRTGGTTRTSTEIKPSNMTSGTPQGTGPIKYIIVTQYKTGSQTGTIDDIDNLQVMLNTGSTPIPYEAYIGQKYEVNLGKNLLSLTDGTYSNNSVSAVVSNGVMTISGTANGHSIFDVPLQTPILASAGILMKSLNATGTYTGLQTSLRASNGTTSVGLWTTDALSKDEKLTGDAYKFRIQVNSGVSVNCTIKPQIEQGITITPFSPYKTPIELNKINTYQDTIFKSSGKNLFDKEAVTTGKWLNQSGELENAQNYVVSDYIEVKEGETYYIPLRETTRTKYYKEDKSVYSNSWDVTSPAQAITIPSGVKYIRFSILVLGTNAININTFQFEKGNQATEYEPYGKQWYIKKSIGKVVLDGSEAISTHDTNNGIVGFRIPTNEVKPNTKVLSDYFNYVVFSDYYNNREYGEICSHNSQVVSNVYMSAPNSSYNTLANFLTWLGTNKPIVYYVLNTPTYTIITDTELVEQLNALRMATSYGEDTNLLISGSGLPLTIDSNNFINDYIDEEFFNDKNVNVGKKYGPVNSLVLSRTNDTDNIYLQDDYSVTANGLCELKIVDNEILSADNRDDYLEGIFNHINGLEYYTNDFQTKGILYYELADIYNVKIDQNYYKCLMLRDDIKRTTGLKEFIKTDEPETTITEYRYANKTDRKINQATLIVNKQEGYIEGLVSKTNTMEININNNYQELKGQFNDYVPQSQYATLETSVRTLQTDTYTKQEINTKLTDGSVTKVMTASGTYDINGMTYEKSNANTKTTINEVGVGVKKTDGTDDYILFAGYVDDNNTQFSDFKGQTLVASENMLVRHYLVVGSKSRMEDYENGTGMFFIGG